MNGFQLLALGAVGIAVSLLDPLVWAVGMAAGLASRTLALSVIFALVGATALTELVVVLARQERRDVNRVNTWPRLAAACLLIAFGMHLATPHLF